MQSLGYLYFYYCPDCGTWESTCGLDLYYPKDIKKTNAAIEEEFNNKVSKLAGRSRTRFTKYSQDEQLKCHVKNWYRCGCSISDEYELIAEYPHICKKCGKQMKRIEEDIIPKEIISVLRCPNCNSNLEDCGFGQWD